jgi:hypothetical protein
MNWLKQLIGDLRSNRHLSLAAKAEHVELTSTHLVLGLKIEWLNKTDTAISVKEFHIRVYILGLMKEPLQFFPLERFERVLTHRAIQKKPVRPFSLPPGQVYSDQIRFISQAVQDIEPGKYTVDFVTKDANDVTYTNRLEIELTSKQKYRHSEDWHVG